MAKDSDTIMLTFLLLAVFFIFVPDFESQKSEAPAHTEHGSELYR